MKYNYLIQKTKGLGGNAAHTFMMLPTATRQRAGEQAKLQKLITSHSMHTCVSIQLEGTRLKFKGSYAKLDGEYHPTLVIISSRDGSFRLPFAEGEEGLEELRKAYVGITVAFRQFENSALARVGSQNYANRIAYTSNGGAEKASDAPRHRPAAKPKPVTPPPRPENVVYLHGARQQTSATTAETRAAAAGAKTTLPKKPTSKATRASSKPGRAPKGSKTSSSIRFMKWVGTGALVSVLVTGVLAASNARASEQLQVTEAQLNLERQLLGNRESDRDEFAGFPVPAIQRNQLVVAAQATPCGIAGLDASDNLNLGLGANKTQTTSGE